MSAKKQSKWSTDEDAKITELRGNGLKWEDISKQLPGRSAISCRLRYQNYLERRSEWDEDRKNKLARLYERHVDKTWHEINLVVTDADVCSRFKQDMWSKIAEEMTLPWRAAEAMHWQMGEQEMARRAGVVAFSLLNTPVPRSEHPQLPSLAQLGLSGGLPRR
jgi:Myb-like DNA-binding domain